MSGAAVSRTVTYSDDPIADCEGTALIVTDCCGAVVDAFTVDTDAERIYCGTGPTRGRCARVNRDPAFMAGFSLI